MEQVCITSLNSKLSKIKSQCKIYRVHQHLRNVNPGAYEPEVISIGPYHRGKGHLKMMENHKLRNLQSLVKRLGSKAVLGVASSKARKCYADQDFRLTKSQFVKMLVLDGCFIIELVRKFADGCLGKKDDPIFQMEWMISSLQRDLMLFENQIPFFVLSNLFHHIKGPDETRTLLQLLTKFFSNLYPGKGHSEELLQGSDHKIKHLLDLIHHNWVLPRLEQLKSSPKKKNEECQKPNCFRTMCCMLLPVKERKYKEVMMGSGMPPQEMKENEIDSMPVLERDETYFTLDIFFNETDQVEMGSGTPLQETEKTEFTIDMTCNETEVEMASGTPLQDEENEVEMGNGTPQQDEENEVEMGNGTPLQDEENEVEMGSGNKENILFINYATELTEANVEFEMEKKDTLFDVYFKDGVMVMPPLHIEDGTECFLRNLIVYEQYFEHQLDHTVVTDYMMLLDNLIDSAKDVEILSRKGIIMNWQGDDEVVANMVNRLGDLVIYNSSNFSYATEFKQVNEHCEKPWNRWIAKLRRDYLNSPWGIISIIAAVVLLLLTVTQTILSILQVVQEK